MSTINTNYFNYSSPLFSSMTRGNSTASSTSNLLGDYMAIRSGSYKKLLKAYYAKVGNADKKTSTSSKKDTVVQTETKELSTAKADATSLKSAADKLTARGLYTKVAKTVKDEKTGAETTTMDYDREAIVSTVKSFAESYNKTLDSAAKQDNTLILRKAAYMTKSTAASKRTLSEIGITIGMDNKLSVDTDKLKKADVNDVRALFEGSNSYAGSVSKRASDIATMAEQLIKNAAKNNASTYTNRGKYTALSTGDLYDTIF